MLPLDLIAFNPLPEKIDWLAPQFLFSIVGTLAISAGLFLLHRRWPGLLAAWLAYLVILAPNSGIIRITGQITADRYSYLSMLGWVSVAAACFCRIDQTSSRWRPAAFIALSSERSLSGPHDVEPVPDLARLEDLVDPCTGARGRL